MRLSQGDGDLHDPNGIEHRTEPTPGSSEEVKARHMRRLEEHLRTHLMLEPIFHEVVADQALMLVREELGGEEKQQ